MAAPEYVDPLYDEAHEPPSGADTYRPLGQIMREIKKADEDIVKVQSRRSALVDELRQVAAAATQYVENIE